IKFCILVFTKFLFIGLLTLSCCNAQNHAVDSNYIRAFERSNVIEIYPDIYSTHFNFSNPRQRKNDYSLVANSNAHISTNLNYKWLSLRYSWAMPGTQLDRHVKLQYTSLGLNFGDKQMRFRVFYESYNGLLVPIQKIKDSFNIFEGIQFTSVGFDYFFFTNTKLFSFSAAKSFSQKQVKSAGSVFLMVTPSWQKINWKTPSRELVKDTATYDLLSQDPEWISLIARLGYTHNFVIDKGKWIIAPACMIGAGFLNEINTPGKRLQPVSNLQGWINAGYNGPYCYFYFHAWWNNLQTNLLIKNMNQVNTNFSLTAGYRFPNFRKKVFRFL
ncbi:MAG: DUF4421 domain-containing protein, partial [Bacteroidota bacterium]|nr:DUF4421 domain-containing protein [Bacteroidota bacterium]